MGQQVKKTELSHKAAFITRLWDELQLTVQESFVKMLCVDVSTLALRAASVWRDLQAPAGFDLIVQSRWITKWMQDDSVGRGPPIMHCCLTRGVRWAYQIQAAEAARWNIRLREGEWEGSSSSSSSSSIQSHWPITVETKHVILRSGC